MKRLLYSLVFCGLILFGPLFGFSSISHATSFTLDRTIDLYPIVGSVENYEVDVVGNELYVQNWVFDRYFRIDIETSTLLGSFALSDGILMDNHGSDYNPVTGTIYHVSDDDDQASTLAYDAFFQTDINGVVIDGTYDLFGPGDNSEDPEGLAVDPFTGRVWVSLHDEPGIFEINPDNGEKLENIYAGVTRDLGFNPITGKLFFYSIDHIMEIATDGTGPEMIFNPGTSPKGMAFAPTGDLVLTDGAQLYLYDSSDDSDNVFTTTTPVPEPTTIFLLSSGLIGLIGFRKYKK